MQSNDIFLRSMAQPYRGPFSWHSQDFWCQPPYLLELCGQKPPGTTIIRPLRGEQIMSLNNQDQSHSRSTPSPLSMHCTLEWFVKETTNPGP